MSNSTDRLPSEMVKILKQLSFKVSGDGRTANEHLFKEVYQDLLKTLRICGV